MSRTIMIMAGGTGGHIFPAMAVAEYLSVRGWHIVWLGTRRGMESRLVPSRGYTMAWVRMSGLRRSGLLRAALLPLNLLIAFGQSARAIFRHRPDVVLGMGGYVTFPGGMMASLLNRPLVIHEQNSIAGLANRVLARLADRVLAAFPRAFGARVDVLWVGNPVREDIAALDPPEMRMHDRSGRLQVLVIGGSLGAQALNETVPQAIARMAAGERPRVTHQSGESHIDALREHYAAAGVDAELVPFIENMAARYAAADLVICRAGATTIAEIAAAGVASVLVPYPHAVDDHQTANARHLSERGAALLVSQKEFTPERLAGLLAGLTREALMAMAVAARALAKPHATHEVAAVCTELAA